MNSKPPVTSPCIGLCKLDQNGICSGCYRTLDEIAIWGKINDAQREEVLHLIVERKLKLRR